MERRVRDSLAGGIEVQKRILETLTGAVAEASQAVAETLTRGNKVVLMGNGGSAAEAQHLAAELVGRYRRDRDALPALALTADTAILTAVGNDYGFSRIFERQVEALVREGDAVIGMSTSGDSENVLLGLRKARKLGARTIALLGRGGGKIAGEADLCIVVPSDETPRIQESHLAIGHIICEMAESAGGPEEKI